MERTDYVAKAKSLLKKTALVIVPLAIAATATAGLGTPTLPTDNASCHISGSAATNGCNFGMDVLFSPGLAGVKFYTDGWEALLPSGSGTSGSFNQGITMSTSGAFFNVLPGSLPVFYDFTLQQDPDVTIDTWFMAFSLSGRYNGSASFSGSGAGTFSGPGLLELTHDSESTVLSLSAFLEVRGSRTGMGQVLLDVPQGGSFDFGASTTAVPEPATVGIAGAGLALVAWSGRRRQRRQ